MSTPHGRQDVYVGGVLRWENATVIEDRQTATIRVRADHKPVANYSEIQYQGREGQIKTWLALDPDEVNVEIVAASRKQGCSGCGT